MRYLNLLIGFLACLWLSIHFMFPGRSLRDWRQQAVTLLGIFGMMFIGLSLWGIVNIDIRRYHMFYSAQGVLVGLFFGVVISLLLAFYAARQQGKSR